MKKLKKPTQNYPTNFARTNYSIPALNQINLNTEFQSEAQPCGKNIPTDTEKNQQKTNIFKTVMKNKLFALENELTYF